MDVFVLGHLLGDLVRVLQISRDLFTASATHLEPLHAVMIRLDLILVFVFFILVPPLTRGQAAEKVAKRCE
jgi:hypothetical protein